MIEDIKKEILKNCSYSVDKNDINNKTATIIDVEKVFEILDKYANESERNGKKRKEPDYKCERTDCVGRISESRVIKVEKKYKAIVEETKVYLNNQHEFSSTVYIKNVLASIKESELKHGIKEEE